MKKVRTTQGVINFLSLKGGYRKKGYQFMIDNNLIHCSRKIWLNALKTLRNP